MSFEQEYYENPSFWEDGAVTDIANTTRIIETISIIPNDICSLLDVGCGNGVFPNRLSKDRPDISVFATDRSYEALKYVETNKKFQSEITEIPREDKSFDCITCLQVIEHIPHDKYNQALSEIARISSKYIVIGVPFNEDLKTNSTECPACNSIFNWDLHLRTYSMDNIQNLFAGFGFELISHKNVGSGKKVLGANAIRKILNKTANKDFNSPICPVCGYKNESFNMNNSVLVGSSSGKLESFVKAIWPKVESPGYWIIALYHKL